MPTRENRATAPEQIAAAALAGALAACALYAIELVFRPYALALASGEAVPYFARMARGAAAAWLVFSLWTRLPSRWAVRLLRRPGWIIGGMVLICSLVALAYP